MRTIFPKGLITYLKLGTKIYFILLLKYTHTHYTKIKKHIQVTKFPRGGVSQTVSHLSHTYSTLSEWFVHFVSRPFWVLHHYSSVGGQGQSVSDLAHLSYPACVQPQRYSLTLLHSHIHWASQKWTWYWKVLTCVSSGSLRITYYSITDGFGESTCWKFWMPKTLLSWSRQIRFLLYLSPAPPTFCSTSYFPFLAPPFPRAKGLKCNTARASAQFQKSIIFCQENIFLV